MCIQSILIKDKMVMKHHLGHGVMNLAESKPIYFYILLAYSHPCLYIQAERSGHTHTSERGMTGMK